MPARPPAPGLVRTDGAGPVRVRLIPVALALFWGLNWPAVKTILTQMPIFSLRAIGFTAGGLHLATDGIKRVPSEIGGVVSEGVVA